MYNHKKIPVYLRVKLLAKLHRRTEVDIHELNQLWGCDFINMSDDDFRSELSYIEHLLGEEYYEYIN